MDANDGETTCTGLATCAGGIIGTGKDGTTEESGVGVRGGESESEGSPGVHGTACGMGSGYPVGGPGYGYGCEYGYGYGYGYGYRYEYGYGYACAYGSGFGSFLRRVRPKGMVKLTVKNQLSTGDIDKWWSRQTL